jgi:hypothetical protein
MVIVLNVHVFCTELCRIIDLLETTTPSPSSGLFWLISRETGIELTEDEKMNKNGIQII